MRVLASIKPVHSLVSAVMQGVGEADLIIRGRASPHDFSLRPSDARNIQNADVIFMIGDAMETSLAHSIASLGHNARVIRLSEIEGLMRLPLREGATFEGHDGHHHHGHEDEADTGDFDMHIWLDPANARVMVRAIAEALSLADADNAEAYAANSNATVARLDELQAQLSADLTPVRERAFFVFHDAYHYFEDRFGLLSAGAASVSPDRSPGARRIRQLRDRITDLGVVCVMTEPQFNAKFVGVIVEGSPARLGVVDPLGALLDSGPGMYFTLLRDMAASFAECLASPDYATRAASRWRPADQANPRV